MIGREDLERALWNAADIVRETFDVHTYKSYLLRLLLLKRLSDVFEEEAEAIERETGSYDLAWNNPQKHRFFVPQDSRWSYLTDLDVQNIGYALNKAAQGLEDANPEVEEIFTSFNFEDKRNQSDSRQYNIKLYELINYFSHLRLRNSNLTSSEVLGEACEYLIERFAADAGRTGGDFYTPRQVSKLLVRLLEPQEGMSICDPVCGAGGLLVECVRQIKQQGGNPRNLLLYGQEKNYETWVIAKINLLLHDIFGFDIRLGDVIHDPQLLQNGELMQFDRIIANPPFNVKTWGDERARFFYERFRYGIPPQSSGDFAFIQHILSTLNETGQAGVVAPPGVLFRGGSEGTIRRGIIEDDLIEVVVGLASNLFYSTSFPTVILIFNREKPAERKGKIIFIDARNEYQKDRLQNHLSDQDIEHIVTVYREFRDEEGYSKVVPIEEIATNDYTLNINRYVLPAEIEIDFDTEINKLSNKLLKLDAELAEAENEINKFLRELEV